MGDGVVVQRGAIWVELERIRHIKSHPQTQKKAHPRISTGLRPIYDITGADSRIPTVMRPYTSALATAIALTLPKPPAPRLPMPLEDSVSEGVNWLLVELTIKHSCVALEGA